MKTGVIGSDCDLEATKKIPGEGFERRCPPLLEVHAAEKAKMRKLFWKGI